MEWITSLLGGWSQFFSGTSFIAAISDPVNLGTIFTLIIMEGLLSADNALVLAVMVRHLPDNQRKKALRWGIFGAFFFRFVFIGLGLWLVKIWWIKLIGAAYLLKLSITYFYGKYINPKDEDDDGIPDILEIGLLGTIVRVELMDLTFSADSILAAFGVSNKVWVLFLGGCLGIIMMRFVAQLFVKLLEKFPELETSAYILITIIGIKMIAGAFDYEMNPILFFGLLIVVFGGTFVIHFLRGDSKAEIAAAKEE